MNSKVHTNGNKVEESDSLPHWKSLSPTPGATRLAVLGYPVKHSRSPEMHNAALRKMSRTDSSYGSWKYFRCELPPQDLPEAIKAFHQAGIKGLNLTIPHKTDILPMIETRPSVERMGAANTLVWKPKGYVGYNTDGIGLERALSHSLNLSIKGLRVLMLGAGGAARATTLHLLEKECRHLYLLNRSRPRAESILDLAAQAGWSDRISYLDSGSGPLPQVDLVINATSLGLKESDPSPLDLTRLTGKPAVYDMIYNPPETTILKEAKALKLPCANGLSMLAYQGIESLKIWSENKVEVPEDAFLLALGLPVSRVSDV